MKKPTKFHHFISWLWWKCWHNVLEDNKEWRDFVREHWNRHLDWMDEEDGLATISEDKKNENL